MAWNFDKKKRKEPLTDDSWKSSKSKKKKPITVWYFINWGWSFRRKGKWAIMGRYRNVEAAEQAVKAHMNSHSRYWVTYFWIGDEPPNTEA